MIAIICSFEIFVAAINFNSLNHGHLKNSHDLETLEKVFIYVFVLSFFVGVCTFMLQGFIRN